MNIRLITRTVGYILWVEGGFLLLPLLVSLGYGDGCWEAFLSAALLCGIPLPFTRTKNSRRILNPK